VRELASIAAAGLLLGSAPFQCGDPEPIRYARRDDPAEVVWSLGVRLDRRGQRTAAHETWRYLIERYPTSRYAERARMELDHPDGGAD
jgi:outer membrane protein assembly factor BamD (BamD/ComL family)